MILSGAGGLRDDAVPEAVKVLELELEFDSVTNAMLAA